MLPQPTSVWLPDSAYIRATAEIVAVNRAVKEYDERLRFGQNQDTGDWCVFILMPPDARPQPVLGWREVPTPEAAVQRLAKSDSVRYGREMWDRLEREQRRMLAESEHRASEETGEAAERLEVLLRKTGDHPSPRIFIPREVT